jgi:uncharacterized RDD family membrane protein YckC
MTDPNAPAPDPVPAPDPARSPGLDAAPPPPPASPPPPAAPAASPVISATTTTAGSAGLVYADVPNRIIAYILDAILIGVLNFAILAILAGIGISVSGGIGGEFNFVAGIIATFVGLAISAGYFIYTWTRLRGTLGMKALGMQVGNAPDGTAMSVEQGVKRWLALGAIFTIAQIFNPFPLIGIVIGLAALAWVIFLLYTTAQSPTKQGWHDHFANTMVVKAARNVG